MRIEKRAFLFAILALAAPFAAAQTPIAFLPPDGYPACVGAGNLVTGDVDQDGLPDVAIANAHPHNQVCVLRNTGLGGFAPGVVVPAGANFLRGVLVDLNDDGRPELVTMHYNPGEFRVRMNLGTTVGSINFGAASSPLALGTYGVNDLASADFDGDGDVDLAFIGTSGTFPTFTMAISVFHNDGTGAFTAGTSFPAPGALGIAAGDLDGDGDQDLAFCRGGSTESYVMTSENDGTGAFGLFFPLAPIPWTTLLTKIRAVDVDGDGDCDLITGYHGIWVFKQGTANFPLSVEYSGSPVSLSGQWVDADFNCDGFRDYVISSNTNGFMYLITGSVAGPSAPAPLGFQGYSLAAAEMNHDAQLDLVCYGEFGVASMLNNSYFPCWAQNGLVTSVNGAPFSKAQKSMHAGDTIRWKTDVSAFPNMRGKPATIFVNVPPESALIAATPVTGLLPVPGFEAVHFMSVPAGPAYFTGDSLYLTTSIGIDLGFGPLAMGDPAYSAVVPPGVLATGDLVRMQAAFYDPHPNNWWVITATNPVRFEMAP
jgi:hypothetical protein